jgi:hypothetical protein
MKAFSHTVVSCLCPQRREGLPKIGPFAGLLLVLILSVPALPGCRSESSTSNETETASTHTLIFLDQSVSAAGDTSARALFADSLRHIVHQHLRRPGDRLSLFLVHEKTLSKAHRVNVTNDVAPLEEKEFPDEQALEKARFQSETEQFLQEATERLQNFLNSPPSTSSEWTDLWGTLGVASTELDEDAAAHHVYYFSDMFESMPGPGRRNFDQRPPQSRMQAQRWAQADVDTLDTFMVLHQDRLQHARVRVLLGTLATKPHAQDVKFYWLTLFEELGLSRAQIDYN